MKKAILFCCVIFLSKTIFAQELRISIAPTNNVFQSKYKNENPYGSPRLGTSYNLDYLFKSTEKLNFGIGIGYQKSSVLKVIPITLDYRSVTERINLCYISFRSVYNLSKQFYLSGDPYVGIQINHPVETIENQSGIGLSFGVGGSFRINNYLLFNVEPRLWMNNLIQFQPQDLPYRLSFAGINLGLVFSHETD